MTFQDQYKHPKWQKKRLEVLELHGFQCQRCLTKDEELHVHHPIYRKGAMVWEYTKEELECLCHNCHKEAHDLDDKIKNALAVCKYKPLALSYILGLNDASKSGIMPNKTKDKRSRRGAVDKSLISKTQAAHLDEQAAEKSAESFFEKMKELMG